MARCEASRYFVNMPYRFIVGQTDRRAMIACFRPQREVSARVVRRLQVNIYIYIYIHISVQLTVCA